MNMLKRMLKSLNTCIWLVTIVCLFYNREYFVFRLLQPEYDENGKVGKTIPVFQQHFVELFKTKYEAKKAIKENGEFFMPRQKFFILSS